MNIIKGLSLRLNGVSCSSRDGLVTVRINRQYIKIKKSGYVGYFALPNIIVASMESKIKTIEPEFVYYEQQKEDMYIVLSFFKYEYKGSVTKEYLLFVFDKNNVKIKDSKILEYENNPPQIMKIDLERKKMFIER